MATRSRPVIGDAKDQRYGIRALRLRVKDKQATYLRELAREANLGLLNIFRGDLNHSHDIKKAGAPSAFKRRWDGHCRSIKDRLRPDSVRWLSAHSKAAGLVGRCTVVQLAWQGGTRRQAMMRIRDAKAINRSDAMLLRR